MGDRLLEHALDGDATTTEWREAGFRAASEAGAFFAVTAGSRMAQAALGITTRAPPVAALELWGEAVSAPEEPPPDERPPEGQEHFKFQPGQRVLKNDPFPENSSPDP